MKTALITGPAILPWMFTNEQWLDAFDENGKPYIPPFDYEGELRRMLTPEGLRRVGIKEVATE